MCDYCNECGRRLESSEETVWCYPISIYGDFSSRYAEPVCENCCDEFYVECSQCYEYHNKACCTRLENGDWICDVCKDGNKSPVWRIVFGE